MKLPPDDVMRGPGKTYVVRVYAGSKAYEAHRIAPGIL